MKQNTTFCEECRDDVEYTVNMVSMSEKIKNKEYHYTGREAHCSRCGALVYVGEIFDENLRSLYDVYRAQNGIVSLDIVQAIPEKYHIGKRPLSLLLGWGEQTFSRYCDGDLPTRQFSDMLIRIYNEPMFFSELLEKNKGSLSSPRSYEKCRRAVDAILSADSGEGHKINSVIRYLLYRCEDITPLALQKALYYIQGFFYAFYQTFLFEEDCEAWVHGPVYRNIYYQYRDYHFDPIGKAIAYDPENFSAGEKAVCDSVILNICCYSGKILERFTHNETPWLLTRGNLPVSAPSDRIIEKSVIGDYFETIKKKYNMVNPNDMKDYTQDMFFRI